MAKVIAITDVNGKLLGVLRADPVNIGNGKTLQAVPSKTSAQRHHFLEVPHDLMGKRADLVHDHVRRLLVQNKA
jgi:hypothetical protein